MTYVYHSCQIVHVNLDEETALFGVSTQIFLLEQAWWIVSNLNSYILWYLVFTSLMRLIKASFFSFALLLKLSPLRTSVKKVSRSENRHCFYKRSFFLPCFEFLDSSNVRFMQTGALHVWGTAFDYSKLMTLISLLERLHPCWTIQLKLVFGQKQLLSTCFFVTLLQVSQLITTSLHLINVTLVGYYLTIPCSNIASILSGSLPQVCGLRKK